MQKILIKKMTQQLTDWDTHSLRLLSYSSYTKPHWTPWSHEKKKKKKNKKKERYENDQFFLESKNVEKNDVNIPRKDTHVGGNWNDNSK